jgi:hypothetical protein
MLFKEGHSEVDKVICRQDQLWRGLAAFAEGVVLACICRYGLRA